MRRLVWTILAAAMLAGCTSVTPAGLRAKPKCHSTYACTLGYEEAYRHLLENGGSNQVLAAAASGVGMDVQQTIYSHAKTAVLFRQYSDGITVQTWWLIDITAAGAGSSIHAYGMTPSLWLSADRLVMSIPGAARTGCQPEYLARLPR